MKKKSKMLRVPAKHNPGRGMPTEFPAFISPAEAQMILRHTDGRAEKGPAGLLSFADEGAGNHNGGYGSGGSSSSSSSHGPGGAGTASHGSGGAGQASHGSGSQGGGSGGASQSSHGAGSQGGGSGGASAGSHGAGGPGNNAGGNSGASRGGQQGGSNVNSGGRPQGAGSGNNFGYGNAASNTAPAGNNFGPRSAMSNSLGVMNQFPGASAMAASAAPGYSDMGQLAGMSQLASSGLSSGLGLQLANLGNVQDQMGSPAYNGSWSPTGIVGNVKQYDDRISPTAGYMSSSVVPNDSATSLARQQAITGSVSGIPGAGQFNDMYANWSQPTISGQVAGMPGAMSGATLNRNRIGAALASEAGAGAGASTSGQLGIGPQGVNIAGTAEGMGGPPGMSIYNASDPVGISASAQGVPGAGQFNDMYANWSPASSFAGLQGPAQAGSIAGGQLGQMAQNMPQPAGEQPTQAPEQGPGILSTIGNTVMDTATGLGRKFVDNVINSTPGEKIGAFMGNMLNQPANWGSAPGMTGPGSNAGQTLTGLLGNGGSTGGGGGSGGLLSQSPGSSSWDLTMYGAQPTSGTGTGAGTGGGSVFPFGNGNGSITNNFGARGERFIDLYNKWKSQGGGNNGGNSPGNSDWALYMYGDPNWKPTGLLG